MLNYIAYFSGTANVFMNYLRNNNVVYKIAVIIGFGLVGCCAVIIHVEDNESSLLGMADGERLLISTEIDRYPHIFVLSNGPELINSCIHLFSKLLCDSCLQIILESGIGWLILAKVGDLCNILGSATYLLPSLQQAAALPVVSASVKWAQPY